MSSELLPRNATPLERALADQISPTTDVDISAVWDPDRCPPIMLPWLAYALSVDAWDPHWPEGIKREVIRQSVQIHRIKGTPASIRQVLVAAGYGDCEVVEHYNDDIHDGSVPHDGTITYAAPDHWAEFRIIMARPISIEQADHVRALVESVKPVRSHLKSLVFTEAPLLHDATIQHAGTHTYGEA